MSRGRPEIPPSYVVDLNDVIKKVRNEINTESYMSFYGLSIDIVIPVYESLKADVASNIVWVLDNKMFTSNKSSFVESLKHTNKAGSEDYYIYDKFKANSYSHKKSYKQLTYEVPYNDESEEPLYIPVYWRVN